MNAVHINRLYQHLPQVFDQICADHEALMVTREQGENVVILSHSDYAALAETAYLLRSPVMAERLRESLESFKQGHGVERQLVEE